MAERFSTVPVAFTIIRDGIYKSAPSVLLSERLNTGYLDGYWDLPSGHAEPDDETPQDTAVRETFEEVGIMVVKGSLELVHIYTNDGYGDEPHYTGFFFETDEWSGTPANCEPHKLGPPAFYPLHNLPNVTPQVRDALMSLGSRYVTFSHYGKDEINPADRPDKSA